MQFARYGIGFAQRRYGTLISAFGFSTGAASYFLLPFEPTSETILLGLAICLAGTILLRRSSAEAGFSRFALAVLTAWVLGVLAGKYATVRVSPPQILAETGPVLVEGWVESISSGRNGLRLRLLVHSVGDRARSRVPDHVRVTHRLSPVIDVGRFVRCWVVLRPPPAPLIASDYAFDREAFYRRTGAVGFVLGRCRPGTLGAPRDLIKKARLRLAELRRALARHVRQGAGERAGGFAAALASGDRSFLASSDQEALRASGLAHLMAISGLHMGLVGGLVFLVSWRGLALLEPLALRVSVRKLAACVAIITCSLYLMLSGASVSTQRAFVMAMVVFGAILVDRAPFSVQSFSLAMMIVVLLAPWSVLSPGFQMSFAATGALVTTFHAWGDRRKRLSLPLSGPVFWVKSLVLTSLVSGLATLPFAIYHFGRIAAFGFPANLLAMPVVSLICTPLAGLAVVLSWLGMGEVGLTLFGWSLGLVLRIAEVFAALGEGSRDLIRPIYGVISLSGILGLGLLILVKGRWRLTGVAPLVLAAVLWTIPSADLLHWAPSGDVFLVRTSGQILRYRLAKGEGLSPLRYRDVIASHDCRIETCEIEAGGVHIRLAPKGDMACGAPQTPDWVFIRDPVPSHCDAFIVPWADVQASRGQSWYIRRNTLQPVKAISCGRRPWRPCPVP